VGDEGGTQRGRGGRLVWSARMREECRRKEREAENENVCFCF